MNSFLYVTDWWWRKYFIPVCKILLQQNKRKIYLTSFEFGTNKQRRDDKLLRRKLGNRNLETVVFGTKECHPRSSCPYLLAVAIKSHSVLQFHSGLAATGELLFLPLVIVIPHRLLKVLSYGLWKLWLGLRGAEEWEILSLWLPYLTLDFRV